MSFILKEDGEREKKTKAVNRGGGAASGKLPAHRLRLSLPIPGRENLRRKQR